MAQDISQNNKRIAKNTLALYIRTFITMIVGLYTGRVMLQALGVEDFGINSVVAGIVAMSGLITSTLSAAISRYITYALGKRDKKQLKTLFSTAINAQIVMAVAISIILEIMGVWFLNTVASIPDDRLEAAYWVFQFSTIAFAISLISSPFSALIIAHERMNIYAYTSIIDAVFKLTICFVIMAYWGDRLILLAILHVVVSLLMQMFYGWYCGRNFEEVYYSPRVFDKRLLKELTVFSGWNILNNGASVFSTQGVSMLVNVFFGVTFNASRSVAMTVNNVVQGFVNNFTVAFSPQITKSYAAGDKEYAVHLVNRGTKFTWLMMYVFIVPVCCEADTLLNLWLGEAPEMAPLFLRFAMFESLAVATGSNMYRLIQADGRVKRYSIHAALMAGLIFPLAWIAFVAGAPVWSAYVIYISIFVLLNFVRFYDLKKLMIFSVAQFMRECINPCLVVSITSFIIPLLICYFVEPGNMRFFANGTLAVFWTCTCCVLFGLTKSERIFFYEKVLSVIKKIAININRNV